jgi:hypothetical protein
MEPTVSMSYYEDGESSFLRNTATFISEYTASCPKTVIFHVNIFSLLFPTLRSLLYDYSLGITIHNHRHNSHITLCYITGSSSRTLLATYFFGLLFHPEQGSTMFLRHVGEFIPDYVHYTI